MRIISGTARGTKLYTLEGSKTRPTLDRVKESVFNIIQNQIKEATVLDLFSGSGAIALEALSRGAKKAVVCDNSKDAIEVIRKNIQKTHFEQKVELYNTDYKKCLENVKTQKFNIIYLDPPYKTNLAKDSIEKILDLNLIDNNSIIIIEKDKEKNIKEIEKLKIQIVDQRKYGRAFIVFAKKST